VYGLAVASGIQKLDWTEKNYHDLILTSALLSTAHVADLPRCALRVPAELSPGLDARLQSLGLKPDRWFATMHWREPSYEFKRVSNPRDADPRGFHPLVDFVIDALGGQVVLLGHPEMHRPAPREGLIDLAEVEHCWNLQAHAMANARFFAGSPSGALAMAHAFLIPAAQLDTMDWYAFIDHDIMLTPKLKLPNGVVLRQEEYFRSGWMQSAKITSALRDGIAIEIQKSTTDEMKRAIQQIYIETDGVTGWREPAATPTSRPNRIGFPPSGKLTPRFLDLG